jgi:hypothetical protein
MSYFFQGKQAEARGPAEGAFRIGSWDYRLVGFLARLLAQAGEKDRAEKLIATIRGTPGMILYHYGLFGDRCLDRLV